MLYSEYLSTFCFHCWIMIFFFNSSFVSFVLVLNFSRLCSVGYVKPYPGYCIYPGYYPTNIHTRTRNFWKFCTTFILAPETSECSVRPCYTTPGTGTACFVPARNFCELCTPVPQYPELLEVLYNFRNRTRNFWKLYKIPISLPETSVTSVRLWHSTRGALYSFRSNMKSVGLDYAS